MTFIFFLCLVSASDFGTTDKEPDSKTDWGGSIYQNTDNLVIDYKDGTKSDYSGVDGIIITSEFGKIVEADFEVKQSGEYVIGNYKVRLEAGSRVFFSDGKLNIDNPGKMYDDSDIGFIDSETGWNQGSVKLSGSGVDYMGLNEVSLDDFGYFLDSPDGIEFDDFKVYARGRVYFLDDGTGEANLDVPGAYISVNPASGKFTIGSNVLYDYIAVKVNPENNYGLKHDVNSDYIAFKSIGGPYSSYLTVHDRTADGLIPRVDAVGYYAVDNNHMSVYRGADGNIYTNLEGSSFEFSPGSGASPSPIELHPLKLNENNEVVRLNHYGGAVVMGNDGALAYNVNVDDLEWTPAGRYQQERGRRGAGVGAELRYGVSNTLTYNYHLNSEGLSKLFGLRINDRRNFLNDPENVRWVADNLYRMPAASRAMRELEFNGISAAGMASSNGKVWIRAIDTETILHEITHIFDFNYGSNFRDDWRRIGGDRGPHTWNYGASNSYEAVAVTGEYILASDEILQRLFNQQGGMRLAAKFAVLGKHGLMRDYDTARILRIAGIEVNPNNPTESYNELINQVAGGNV